MQEQWDFAVVGGGIGGLAVAELLQRSGASVVLIEQHARLCSGASSEQQGWFHTGALYTALPTNFYCRTMVGNLDDLVDYYSAFPNMNLRVAKHVSTAATYGWFANKTNFYAYDHWKNVSFAWKLPWAVALTRARQRMSWFENLDSSRSLSPQVSVRSKPTKFVEHTVPLDVNLGATAFSLKSRDRAMDTALIAGDLLRAFIQAGGAVRCSTEVTTIARKAVHVRNATTGVEQSITARHIIVTAGKAVGQFGVKTKVMISPLLVAVPALADINFVRMSPHFDRTINHLVHSVDGVDYSVMGNAVYFPAAEATPEVIQQATDRMRRLADDVFGGLGNRRTELFFGYKTEIVSSSQMRNYLYHIVETDTHTVALPGKFTLCFSLAVNVCRRFGIDPVERVTLAPESSIAGMIEAPKHQSLARALIAQQASQPVPAFS